MISSKTNKKKNIVLSAVLGIILLIVLFLLFNKIIFSKDGSDVAVDIKNIFSSKQSEIKKLNLEVLNNKIFIELRDNSVTHKDIDNLQIGKRDPFAK